MVAAVNPLSLPSRACIGAIVVPTAAAAAMADPLTEPNSMLARTLVWASGAGVLPTSTFARSMSRVAIPPLFMMPPASTKNGMASRANELTPVNIRCTEVMAPFSSPGRAS